MKLRIVKLQEANRGWIGIGHENYKQTAIWGVVGQDNGHCRVFCTIEKPSTVGEWEIFTPTREVVTEGRTWKHTTRKQLTDLALEWATTQI
jgi:hypothetical protein|tara:strand:- start:2239 stop:2511 length:273 start_codon:yes stop_codon:yes gene_type:complete